MNRSSSDLQDGCSRAVQHESETLKSQQLQNRESKQDELSMHLVSSIVQDGQAKAVLQEVHIYIYLYLVYLLFLRQSKYSL